MSIVLMYHYIGTPSSAADPHRGLFVSPSDLGNQLETLKRLGIRTVSPEEYDAGLDAGALRRSVWMTFDDGMLDNFEVALGLLTKHRQRATFFIITDRSFRNETGYMTVSMMREMQNAGMSIGSHSCSHAHLARIPRDQMREEVTASKKRLEDALGTEVTSFCYPYGNFDDAVEEAVREAGYRLATSTIRDNRNSAADRFHLKRAMVQPGRTDWRFRYLFSPLYHWVHDRKNRRRWKKKAR